MFRSMLGDPNGNDFIQCIMGHPAAVHTAHVNRDSELVIQPRATGPVLREQPRGNQPLPVSPGRPCPKPGALLLAPGRSGGQESCPAAGL